MRFAWVLVVLCSLGCVSRETVRIELPAHVRTDLLETNTKTLLVAVERFSRPDRPTLERLDVISDPSTLDDASLAAALPQFDDRSGAPVAITLLAYAFSRKDLAIPADGDLLANRAVDHSEPIPAPQLAYRLEDGAAPIQVWQRHESLPSTLKLPLPLPARKSGCRNVVATTLLPQLGRHRFDTVVGVHGRFLVSAHDMDTGQPVLYALNDQNEMVVTATLAGRGTIYTLAFDGTQAWGGMSDGSLLKISPAGAVDARLPLASGLLSVSVSPDRRLIAYSEAELWEVSGGTTTTTRALPAPPRPINLLAAAPAGRLLGVRRDNDALGTSLTTFTYDGQSWHEDSPSDGQSLPTFGLGPGFAAIATNPGRLRDTVARRCQSRGWEAWIEPLTAWLLKLITQPLRLPALGDAQPLSVSLAGLTTCIPEMEFWLAAHCVDTQVIDQEVSAHTLGGAPRPALATNLLNGMLKGFMDLVFAHQGRYYVADYKSNWLGPDAAAYTTEAMSAEILHARYELQYVLYLLALHRLLKVRLPDYDYDRHVGGAVYLFLRGLAAPSQGLHCERPPRELIEALDALFSRTTPEVTA